MDKSEFPHRIIIEGIHMKTRTKTILAEGSLLLAAMIWGIAFVVMKNAVDVIPPNFLLAIRFSVSAICMAPFLIKRLKKLDRGTLIGGILAGIFMYLAFMTQTIGLQYTTAGKNAFITTVYVVLTPFCIWMVKKQRPGLYTLLPALICFTGIGILSLAGESGINIGDVWTLACGILFAWHFAVVDHSTGKGRDVMVITLLQFATAGILGWILGFATETFPTVIPGNTWLGLGYLSIFSSLLGLTLQNVGVKYANGSHASLLLSLESLFGCLSGVIFLKEPLTPSLIIGGILILTALVLSEVKPKGKKQKME